MDSKSKLTAKLLARQAERAFLCLRSTALFFNLTDNQIQYFCNSAQSRSYKKGQILYLQEEVANFFYIIHSGWIKLFHTTHDGDELVVDMLTIGDVVGESAIFENDCHTSSAQIVEDAELLSIPASLLKKQIGSNPNLAISLLSSMSRQHRHHYGELALNAMQNAPQRIGGFFLKLCPISKSDNVTIYLPYDKTLIASILGMKGATFSRALNILRKKADVEIHGSCVTVGSVESLAQFVHGVSWKSIGS